MLVEVKPRKFLKPELNDKFDAARRYAQGRGWSFEIWTENEIRIPRLENAKFLLPYMDVRPTTEESAKLISALSSKSPATVSDLLDSASNDNDERAVLLSALWHLVACGDVSFDADEVLTPTSLVRVAVELRS